jgi:ribulose kinase
VAEPAACQLVFEAEKAFQMIAKHLQTAPVPPPQRTDQLVSPELERLILKYLAKNASDRPQSAAHVVEALEWIPADAWGEEQAAQWWAATRSAQQPATTSSEKYPTGVDNPERVLDSARPAPQN